MNSAPTIRVKMGSSIHKVHFTPNGTVLEIKEQLSAKIGLNPNLQRLVYKGALLSNEISPGYYGITESSIVYLLPFQNKKRRIRPSELYEKLCKCLWKLLFSINPQKDILLGEIIDLLENPLLQAFSRINPESQLLMKEALSVISNCRDANNTDYATIAQLNDFAISKLEQTAEGIEALKDFFGVDTKKKDFDFFVPTTNLDYVPSINEEPLPNPWKGDKCIHPNDYQQENTDSCSKRILYANLINTLKAKFAR